MIEYDRLKEENRKIKSNIEKLLDLQEIKTRNKRLRKKLLKLKHPLIARLLRYE